MQTPGKYLTLLWNKDWYTGNYQITRFLILRLLGLVYFIAFLIIVEQGLPLIGSNGILPVDRYLELQSKNYSGVFEAFFNHPTLFWFHFSDGVFLTIAWLGVLLSFTVMIGCSNAVLLLLLWLLYLSFVNVGQIWYGYGWETQLLETGFLAIFLCPWKSLRSFPRMGTPIPVIWLFRWLTVRIMLGSGLIKIRGDECWTKLTCLDHHYETQPIPNFVSRYLHFLPGFFHRMGVLFNHFVELICPFFTFGPRILRLLAGSSMAVFQLILIVSGNLSFLNWLTLIPILSCFDDQFFKALFPIDKPFTWINSKSKSLGTPKKIQTAALVLLVVILSYYPVMNLIATNQVMNTSFTPFRLVNSYGAFGSVGEKRYELIILGKKDIPGSEWKEYDFPAKPGPTGESPPWISPYHYRMDWQLWFAAMSRPNREPWLMKFVYELLQGNDQVRQVLETDPFEHDPPDRIRIDLYRYKFTEPDGSEKYWKRSRVGRWLPEMTANNQKLRRYLKRLKLLRNFNYEGIL